MKKKPMTDRERICCLERRIESLTRANNIVPVTTDYTVLKTDGVIIIGTAAANAADITFPDPTANKKRILEVVNFSGASQNLISHNGTALTIKNITGPAVATSALENATTTTTGRRKYKSDGITWNLVSI